MKLTWSHTGDSLDLDLVDPPIFEYWVDQLNKDQKNQFYCVDTKFIETQPLTDAVVATNTILEKFKLDPLMDPDLDWINQDNLNILHEKWVKLQHQHKSIVDLMSKMPNGVVDHFHAVNKMIHKIEQTEKLSYTNGRLKMWQTVNIFGSDILKFGTWQIELHYQNLGRSNYEKWKNYDANVDGTDTNNLTHLGGLVQFNIGRPLVQSPPANYVEYCQQNNIKAYGNKLPLGNFKIAISDLRHLFNKNVNIKNNTIAFEV
jgi:hypothetical protein